jgi:hypothetical protein
MTVSEKFLRSVNYLHSECKRTEWSGMLLYKIKGSLDKLQDLKVHVEDFILCDIGTHSFTSYSHADSLDELEDNHPNYSMFSDKKWDGVNCKNGYKVGQLHTHHSMEAFFSGVDLQELVDNTTNYGLYISLIVNFDGNWCAKGSFIAKTKTKVNLSLHDFPTDFCIEEEKDEIVTFDFIIDKGISESLSGKLTHLRKLNAKKEAEKKLAAKTGNPYKKPFVYSAEPEDEEIIDAYNC